MGEEYGFWSHKFDFAEINKYNWKIVIRDNYQLSIKRVTLLAMLFAFEILLTIFSKYVLGGLTIGGFYSVEVSFFGILFIQLTSNTIYASIINIIVNVMRIVMPLESDPIGVAAMTLTDITFLFSFALVFFLFKKYIVFKRKLEKRVLYYIIFAVISGLIVTVFTAFVAFICNEAFFFEWYRQVYPSLIPVRNSTLWFSILFIGVGVTILKFTINLFLFAVSLKILIRLINKHLF